MNLKHTSYSTIQDVPDIVFKALGCDKTLYFNKFFLHAFAKANSQITHHYLVITAQAKPVSLVCLQFLEVALDQTTENLSLTGKMAKTLQCFLYNKKIAIAVCGNLYLSGNYGIYIKEKKHANSINAYVGQVLKKTQQPNKPSVLFIKDFTNEDLDQSADLQNNHFAPFALEPNMVLDIKWDTFEAYKTALKSKYRVKVNKADKQSNALVVKEFTANDISQNRATLQQLYANITDKAVFKTAALDIAVYATLKSHFPEKLIFKAYYLEQIIVGFSTAFITNNRIDAHFIGLDYALNKEHSIYPRILNDYVKLAIHLKANSLNLGRTSSEIKSTLGAVPTALFGFVRHRRTLANSFFKPLVRQIKMTDYKQHRPFKL